MSDIPVNDIVDKTIEGAPITPPASTISDEQINSIAQARAEEIATSHVEKLKEELAESLSGKKTSRYGANGPESWDKLHDEIATEATERAVKIAEDRIEKRLKAEKEALEQKEKMTQKQIEDAQKAEFARISAEWSEAVADGILPDISSSVKEKLKTGVSYEDLSDDERRDPGLRAYNEARILHIQLKNEGKSNSFYRTASQFYNKRPAGVNAPVLGGVASSPSSSESELSYDEVRNNRKAKFGF